jgi:hypothetical protein
MIVLLLQGNPHFTLSELLPGLGGALASVPLRFPDALLGPEWVQDVSTAFDSKQHSDEAAYVGSGTDEFADAWVWFRRHHNPTSSPPVLLCIQSKPRQSKQALSASAGNIEKSKAEVRLPLGTQLVLVLVGYARASAEPGPNQYIVTAENMRTLYGRLATRRAAAMRPSK